LSSINESQPNADFPFKAYIFVETSLLLEVALASFRAAMNAVSAAHRVLQRAAAVLKRKKLLKK
jgi:hypothetical protein